MWLLHMASTAIAACDSHMTDPHVACGGHMTDPRVACGGHMTNPCVACGGHMTREVHVHLYLRGGI